MLLMLGVLVVVFSTHKLPVFFLCFWGLCRASCFFLPQGAAYQLYSLMPGVLLAMLVAFLVMLGAKSIGYVVLKARARVVVFLLVRRAASPASCDDASNATRACV